MEKTYLISAPIAAEMAHFRSLFQCSLVADNPLLQLVTEHILRKSGKMMRPMLVLLTAKLLGEVNEATYRAALALELLHNASLVHDDVVDESDERRGQPSVNALFNNKVAVLSGDYLLASALLQVTYTQNLEIVRTVSQLGQDLADGELIQLDNVGNDRFSEEVYYEVIRKKTAVLFAACTSAGALSVGASEEQVERARQFGEYVGLCFQIRDDIFDYFDDHIGKPTGNDMKEGKLTLPVIHVLNSTQDSTATQLGVKVKHGEASKAEIAQLIEFTKAHGGIDYAVAKMHEFEKKACDLLASIPDSPVKQALYAYLDCVINRSK